MKDVLIFLCTMFGIWLFITFLAQPRYCETIYKPRSSLIEGAEYCANKTLRLDLGRYVYSYENVKKEDWDKFNSSDSLGHGFQKYIKKQYIHSKKIDGIKGSNDIN